MGNVAVITDSLACLPRELAEKHGIFVVPSSVIIGDRVYLDGVDITPSTVYELQRRTKILPTTSAASPGELVKIYRAAGEKASAILHVCITRSLTMAYDSAVKAKEIALAEMPGVQIEVLDTGTAAGAQGFLAIAAAKVAAGGGSLPEAIAEVERLIPRVHLYVTVDTLYFLAKGGRVPKVAAWASSLLSIKPILQISRGEATPVERVRTKPRAMNRLLEIMRQKVGTKRVHVNLVHAGVPDEAEDFKKKVLARFDCVELYISEFSPVMGAHTGPGLLGFAFYCDE
ncbi:MAG: DegV family protein [Chloroflexi bacterium]|nr:DegV family protein [Chloroflexota bacterium]